MIIRSHGYSVNKIFVTLLSLTFVVHLVELEQNTPRLPLAGNEDVRFVYLHKHCLISFFQTIVAPLADLHIDGAHLHVQSPPLLSKEEEECLDFKGPTWIDTARLREALRKTNKIK